MKDIAEKSQNILQKFIVNQLEKQLWNVKGIKIKEPYGHLITITQSNIGDTDVEKLMNQTSKKYLNKNLYYCFIDVKLFLNINKFSRNKCRNLFLISILF